MSSKCAKCTKTVYPVEKIEAGNAYHKGCFRCMDESCNITLNLKTVLVSDGKIYCAKHVPTPKHTSVSDSLSVSHALNAPKKASEGLHKTQVGTGDASNVGLDSVSNQHALNAPKKVSEGLTKTYVGSTDQKTNESMANEDMPNEEAANEEEDMEEQ